MSHEQPHLRNVGVREEHDCHETIGYARSACSVFNPISKTIDAGLARHQMLVGLCSALSWRVVDRLVVGTECNRQELSLTGLEL